METLGEELLHGMAQKADTFKNGQLSIRFTRMNDSFRVSVGELLPPENGHPQNYSPRFLTEFRNLHKGEINGLLEQTAAELGAHATYFNILLGDEIILPAQKPSILIPDGPKEYRYRDYDPTERHKA